MNEFTHTNKDGKAVMVDISSKKPQKRTAIASGKILLKSETIELINQNLIKKGDVISIARIASIQGAKSTSSLIPLCHPIGITSINVDIIVNSNNIEIISTVSCVERTGIEMEALTSVSVGLLTIYDMCKAVDKNMMITDIKLISKTKEDI